MQTMAYGNCDELGWQEKLREILWSYCSWNLYIYMISCSRHI